MKISPTNNSEEKKSASGSFVPYQASGMQPAWSGRIRKTIAGVFLLCCLSCENQHSHRPLYAEAPLIPLHTPALSPSGESMLFCDPEGQAYLSWIEKTDSTHRLQYSRFEDTGWSAPVTIASGKDWFVNWADYPQFAASGKNHFMATFLQKSSTGTYAYDVMLTWSANGADWSTPVKLNEDGKEAEHGFVSIIPYQDNQFMVSWLDGRHTVPEQSGAHPAHEGHAEGSPMTLRVAVLDTAGKKIEETELDSRTCDCCQTSAAVSALGPLVIYRDRSENETRDIYITRKQDGRWQQPQPLHTDGWIINGCPVNGPHVEAASQTVAVAWYTEGNNRPSVLAAFSDDGGTRFGKPIQIHNSIPLGRVDLALLDEKTAVVTWMEGENILVKKVQADGATGRAAIIAHNSAARSAGFPQVTRSGNNLLFAWTDDAGKFVKTGMIRLDQF